MLYEVPTEAINTMEGKLVEEKSNKLLAEFPIIFEKPTALSPRRAQDHHIHLHPGAPPVSVRPYKQPQFQKNEIEKIVQNMLSQGLIKESCGPYSSPVILVKKKDGSWRMCVDYRALNSITIKDKFPILTDDELLSELKGSFVFSKLDLRSGYHQILINPSDTEKSVFHTHQGHYEFLVMPFGLTNVPTTFQATMNRVFK